MENRKTSQATAILDTALEFWNLSIKEKQVLDDLLILLVKNDVKKLRQVQLLLDEEVDDLLDSLEKKDIEKYAYQELEMVSKEDEDELIDALDDLNFKWIDKVDIDEYDDDEVIEEFYGRDLDRFGNSRYDIVTQSDLKEMNELFLNISPQKRSEVINNLK